MTSACPMHTTVDQKKHEKDPAPDDLKYVSIESIKHGACPAFPLKERNEETVAACPFRTMKEEATRQCPAFKESKCPFRDCSTAADMWDIMGEMPTSHMSGSGRASAPVGNILRRVHELSVPKKAELGECPVFTSACPFKNFTSGGRPLVEELDYRSWPGLFDDTNLKIVQEDEPQSKEMVVISLKLKTGTRKAHRAAENVRFVREFLRGRIAKAHYAVLLQKLFVVYVEMEKLLRDAAQNDPRVAAIHFPTELERADTLAKDLDFLCGTSAWRDSDHIQRPSDAVAAYVARLRTVAEEQPIMLLAHSYTRYLGDLSGGQILKRRAKKTYSLPTTGEGVRFYEFPAIKSARAFKEEYKTKLNELDLEIGLVDALVAESNLAFKFNTDIFLEMDTLCGLESLPVRKRKQNKKLSSKTATGSDCPFGFGNAKARPSTTTTITPASNCPMHSSTFQTTKMQLVVVGIAVVVAVLSWFFHS